MKNKVFWLFIFLIGGLIIYNYYPEQKLPANADINLLVVNKSTHEHWLTRTESF